MYLKELYVENVGPLRQLALELPFTLDGSPKPVVFVGLNGSGKTTLLSIIADALFEASAPHHSDIVPTTGLARNWFRLSGGQMITTGMPGECALLRFDHGGAALTYKERARNIPVLELRERVPASLRNAVDWADNNPPTKEFSISEMQAREIFGGGAYVFFPSSSRRLG